MQRLKQWELKRAIYEKKALAKPETAKQGPNCIVSQMEVSLFHYITRLILLKNDHKLWPRMRNYALDGRYHLDNNDVERGQRPSVMGRKNYLFSHDDKRAEDNAIFYSLLESCDVMQLNPLDCLTDILGRLRDNMDEEEITQFLPYQYKKSRE